MSPPAGSPSSDPRQPSADPRQPAQDPYVDPKDGTSFRAPLPGSPPVVKPPGGSPGVKVPPKASLVKIIILGALIVTGAAIYFVTFSRAATLEQKTLCASNLRQLHQLGYLITYKMPEKRWLSETGGQYWQRVAELQAQGKSFLACPMVGGVGAGQTSYRGPAKDMNDLVDEDIIGADVPGNHGSGQGGTVIYKNGIIRDVGESSDEWKKAETSTRQ